MRGSAELAHRERDFGVGNDAPGARYGFSVPETACRAPQQIAAAGVFTKLRHRDTPHRQRWRVVPQGDVLQRGKGVTAGKEAGGCGEGRVQFVTRQHRRFATSLRRGVRLVRSARRP